LRPIAANPGALLTRLNRDLTRILRQTGDTIFVTAAYAVLSLDDGTLRYAQAGHPTPLKWDARADAVRSVPCTPECAGPALGLIDEFEFATSEESFAVGDRLVLFTDGLFEATNAAGEEFGLARLAAGVARSAPSDTDSALGELLREVSTFCAGASFADDICVVAATLYPN
jgi:sigma-B regulation protein RsbU (phosphoserine phosphatase)